MIRSSSANRMSTSFFPMTISPMDRKFSRWTNSSTIEAHFLHLQTRLFSTSTMVAFSTILYFLCSLCIRFLDCISSLLVCSLHQMSIKQCNIVNCLNWTIGIKTIKYLLTWQRPWNAKINWIFRGSEDMAEEKLYLSTSFFIDVNVIPLSLQPSLVVG